MPSTTTATSVNSLTVPAGAVPSDVDKVSLRRNANAALTHTSLDDNFHNLTTRLNSVSTSFNQLLTDLQPIATTGDYSSLNSASGQPDSYNLSAAQVDTLGGVMIPADGGISNTNGSISVDLSSISATDLGLTIEDGWEISGGVLRKKPWTWLSTPHELIAEANAFTNSNPFDSPSAWTEVPVAGITADGATLPSQVNEVILRWSSNEISLFALTPQIQEVCHSADDENRTWNFILPVVDLPKPWIDNTNAGGTASASTMLTGNIVVSFYNRDADNGGFRGDLQLLAYR